MSSDEVLLRLGGRWAGAERPTLSALEAVRLEGHAPAGSRLELRDAAGVRYASRQVDRAFALDLPVGCTLGDQKALLISPEGRQLAEVAFRVDAASSVRCSSGGYGELWNELAAFVRSTRRVRDIGGKRIAFYVTWLRDETHVMKASKYWEPTPGQLHEHFLDIQAPEGIIYDYIMSADAVQERAEVFEPRYSRIDVAANAGYNRLPVEADVEYLAVEGVYTTWQATGDNDWMARQLPRLERGLNYMMTDPLRWSPEHGLVKRAYTIDTWDFKFFGFDRSMIRTGHDVQEYVFNIHPDTPMCIMHGDNSGMYQACWQMARMFAALGNEAKRAEYEQKAEMFRRNTNKHCWNGRYYDHWVPVTPLNMDQGGVDGAKVLSLSNPYDINRGLPDHAQAASIIREYMRIREETKDKYMAEWFSVYPWWPKGFSGVAPVTYVNGGIIIIVAGELAKAAFHHGFEQYGADILTRVHALLRPAGPAGEQRGRRRSPLPCTFTPTGELSQGIPDTWAHAAVLLAIMEGLCGLRDESVTFNQAAVEPRWVAAGVAEASATARYGASAGYVGYRFQHDAASRRITLLLTGSGRRFNCHVLLPAGTAASSVECDGRPVPFQNSSLEGSRYVDFALDGSLCSTVTVAYQ